MLVGLLSWKPQPAGCWVRPCAKLSKNVMVLDRESDITSGTANSHLSKGGVADAEHTELSGQAIQVQTDTVEVGIGSASSQCGGDGVLCRGILRHRLQGGVKQDRVDVR